MERTRQVVNHNSGALGGMHGEWGRRGTPSSVGTPGPPSRHRLEIRLHSTLFHLPSWFHGPSVRHFIFGMSSGRDNQQGRAVAGRFRDSSQGRGKSKYALERLTWGLPLPSSPSYLSWALAQSPRLLHPLLPNMPLLTRKIARTFPTYLLRAGENPWNPTGWASVDGVSRCNPQPSLSHWGQAEAVCEMETCGKKCLAAIHSFLGFPAWLEPAYHSLQSRDDPMNVTLSISSPNEQDASLRLRKAAATAELPAIHSSTDSCKHHPAACWKGVVGWHTEGPLLIGNLTWKPSEGSASSVYAVLTAASSCYTKGYGSVRDPCSDLTCLSQAQQRLRGLPSFRTAASDLMSFYTQ
ncbi:uncharacterized protein B0T15DRAFT_297469 [Chaetomium strumarium]|uniref:Uncharacterized protein n=1 Tax=Chaetomium strumarium TaxID=1170767 RepID=A0AAJ0GM59_9PEZI|nr:hypothetical protein B0T15DRAFT_297469 [Chaetomium strumarium]